MSHEERLTEANNVVLNVRKELNKELYPIYHIAPYAGWMNDPTGLVYFKGLYHVFYQHNPRSSSWGPMHWGHLTSEDMIHWRHHPISLAPGDDWDRDGCLSGSAVCHDDKLYVIYTGHHWLSDESYGNQMYQVQCLAVSEDGFNFEKKGIVVKPPATFTHFCGPKVLFEGGRWWMICGGRDNKDQGQLLLYSTDDIEDWDDSTFVLMAKTDDRNVFTWESPDFFSLGGNWVLMFSRQGVPPRESSHLNSYEAGAIVGEWSPDQDFLATTKFQVLDLGHDFYAPQSFPTPDGRRVLIGWLDVWDSNMPTKGHNWSGVLTIPREIIIDEQTKKLRLLPIRELELIRKSYHSISAQSVKSNAQLLLLEECSAHELKIVWDLENSTAEKYGLWLGRGLELVVDRQTRRFVINRHYPEYTISGYRSCELGCRPLLFIHAFFDRSTVEVFVNNGEYTMSSRIYPSHKDRTLSLFAINGKAEMTKCEIWTLDVAIMQ